MSSIIIIPARMASDRFPDKPLAQIKVAKRITRSLLLLTYQQAKKTQADYVLVTSPDRVIGRFCEENGLTFFPSPATCKTGTERCAEIAQRMKRDFDVYVNWQVDEPTIPPNHVDRLIEETRPNFVGTLVQESEEDDWLYNVHRVKARVGYRHDDYAFQVMDFTRAPLPYAVEHVGIYSFTKSDLLSVAQLETESSRGEALEQLAWMQYGHPIFALYTQDSISVNIPEDVYRLEAYYAKVNSFG